MGIVKFSETARAREPDCAPKRTENSCGSLSIRLAQGFGLFFLLCAGAHCLIFAARGE
jgi:hypothetical protein